GVVAAAGSASESAVLVFTAFVLIGIASGVALLARTAAGDMYPPERRAHGIALVLFVALVLVLFVRPDPRRIADLMGTGQGLSPSEPPPATGVPLSQIVRRPGVIP